MTAEPNPGPNYPARRNPDRNFVILRSLMLALSVAIAVFLLATGHLIFGLLFAALAATRMAMFFSMRKRRSQLRERLEARATGGPGRWGDGPGPTR